MISGSTFIESERPSPVLRIATDVARTFFPSNSPSFDMCSPCCFDRHQLGGDTDPIDFETDLRPCAELVVLRFADQPDHPLAELDRMVREVVMALRAQADGVLEIATRVREPAADD